jgi:hypothetical protein
MTRGVYYACLTPIKGTPDAQTLLTYVGRLFEAYAGEMLQDAHKGEPEVRVIGEQPYDNRSRHTSDVAIVDGSDLILIETEAHRFTKDARLSGGPSPRRVCLSNWLANTTVIAASRRDVPGSAPIPPRSKRRPAGAGLLPDSNRRSRFCEAGAVWSLQLMTTLSCSTSGMARWCSAGSPCRRRCQASSWSRSSGDSP